MKSLTRTIIVLVVINLAMGNLALAQAEGQAEPTARRRSPMPTPPKPTQPGTAPPTPTPAEPTPPTLPALVPEAPVPPEPPMPSAYPTQARSTGHISSRKVLVIPATDIEAEDLVEITQDLLVMSHILDERFREPRTIKRVFTDFGDFFGRNNRSTETIYMQGYGVVFLMEVNFAFSPPLISEEQKDEETAEQVDPTWQRARQQIFSPKAPRPGMPGFSEQGHGLVKFDQLKKELIETLKHAANIRNLSPDEWIIVTVIGQGRQGGVMYFSNEPLGAAAPRSNYSSSYSESEQSVSSEEGGYAASRSSGVAGGGMGGYGRGMMGGYGGGMMGGYGGGMGGFGGGVMMGGMAGYGEMGFPTATILTIRAKKSDVDDFAKGELDFEEFQQMVQIFMY